MNKLLSIIAVLIFFQPVWAQSQERVLWSLEDCINYGLKNSLSLEQAQLAEEHADISLRQAQHQRFPNLSASSSLSYSVGRSIDPTTNDFISTDFISNGVSLSSGVTLFDGLRLSNNIKKSKLDRKASVEDTRQWQRDVAMNIATVYMSILFATENLENAQNQMRGTQDQLDKMNKLIVAGARPGSDKYDIEAQLALDEQNIVRLQNDLEKAYLDLKNVIRYKENSEIRVSVPNIEGLELTDPEQWKMEELYISSMNHQPSILAGEIRYKSAKYDESIAKGSYYPSLRIGGSVSTNYSDQAREITDYNTVLSNQTVYLDNNPVVIGFETDVPIFGNIPYLNQMNDNFGFGAGLQLSIPIYSNYQNKANVSRAKLNTKNVELSNELDKQQLKSSINMALSNAKAAKKQLAAARKSVEAFQIAFGNAEKRYELGQIGSYEYLDLKNRLDNAKTTLLIARYDFIFSLKVIDFYIGLPLNF
jgi:outer membrane protein